MKPWLKVCWQGTRFCGACLLSFCLWTLWLALAVLLVFQIYLLSSRELALPAFVLHAFEERLAASGVHVTFGRASFDPSGHVLLENVHLTLPTFNEPVLGARTLYITLDPWALVVGDFEPEELQAEGVNLYVPAMLSPSGRSESLLRDLSFTLIPGEREFTLPQLIGRLGPLQVSARGAFDLGPVKHGRQAPLPVAELLAQHYPVICRRLLEAASHLEVLEEPSLALVLTPSERRGAIASVDFLARRLDLASAMEVTAADLRVRTRLPLLGDAPTVARIELSASRLDLPQAFHATGVQAVTRIRVQPGQRSFDPRFVEATFAALSGQGLTATDVSLRATPGPLPKLDAEVLAHVLGEPIAASGNFNPLLRTTRFRATGRLSPALLEPLGRKLGRDLRPFVNFAHPVAFDLETGFDPGWKFNGVTGRVSARDVTAYHVTLNLLEGHVAFDGRRFVATDAIARLGTNFARGSFEQDFASREFRFLLQGELRPPAIGGWFREWWPAFWNNFDFTAAAPVADVDVHGFWGRGHETTVFVFADCVQPAIRGVALDHAITRIFIRPHFYDAMEIFLTRGTGSARGWFTRSVSDQGFVPKRLEFDFDSTLELAAAAQLVGPELAEAVKPFVFTNTPELAVHGAIDGPAAPGGEHRTVHVEGHTTGAFTYYNFPLNHLSFGAEMKDDVLTISPLDVGFAGGKATGKIGLSGPANHRRLGFDLSIRDANLREAIIVTEKFAAEKRHRPLPATSEYVERTANVSMELDISADGLLDDPYSFTGNGSAVLNGQGLGKIRLLGLLSELLNFTALQFDSLETHFTVEQSKLVFPKLDLTGPNAAVEAHGSYLLEKRELDFNARVYPFQQSKFILKNVVGMVLTPLSNILEVKLGGSLEKPSWAFVIGPTNFLRNLFSTPEAPKDQPKIAPLKLAPPAAQNP